MNYLLFVCLLLTSQNSHSASFAVSKKVAGRLFGPSGRTFYCGCRYVGGRIDLKDCLDFIPGSLLQSDATLEWEHIIPASSIRSQIEHDIDPEVVKQFALSHSVPRKASVIEEVFKKVKSKNLASQLYKKLCNQKSYRVCARAILPFFKEAEGDLHNLVPVLGKLNRLRSNLKVSTGDLARAGPGVKMCQLYFSGKLVLPGQRIKGYIARLHLYFEKTYSFYNLSRADRTSYARWSKNFPATRWERNRNLMIRRHLSKK